MITKCSANRLLCTFGQSFYKLPANEIIFCKVVDLNYKVSSCTKKEVLHRYLAILHFFIQNRMHHAKIKILISRIKTDFLFIQHIWNYTFSLHNKLDNLVEQALSKCSYVTALHKNNQRSGMIIPMACDVRSKIRE